MTVPADASVNTTSSTNKLRPLTALPVPMLPSAEQLAKARPQASTPALTPPGTTRPTSIKNASLSSWLSHGTHNGTTGNQPPGSKGHSTDVIYPEDTVDHPKIGPDHSQEQASIDSMDVDGHHDTDAHPRDASSSHTPPPPPNGAPVKGKRGRKPKPKPDPNDPNAPPPKPKERKPRTPKDQLEPKEPKEPKEKTPKKKKADLAGSGDIGGDGTTGRSILNYFKSSSGPGKTPSAKAFKQSCLAFDVVDAEKARSYFTAGNDDDRHRYGGIMRDIPKLVGRAPYEDLVGGLLLRSSRLPTLHKLELQQQEITMDMLADIKMVHEFLNTFGTPLGLTKDSGEWITFDSLLSMIKNPRVDSRLLDLNYRMVLAAYDEDQSSRINYHNFTYFLATGPEAVIGNKNEKKNKNWALKKPQPLNRLGTLEYSSYTSVDRIEALAKALHDITSSDKFHSFMRDKVEENIIVLKRQKRKRAEIRKELETQVHDLEREMKVIERDAGVMEAERQSILATERENGQAEDEGGRISSTSRQQRLAQAKDARTKANELLSQQKVLVSELKVKESTWETKKQELEVISRDDTEMQKDHNVPWTQLRGGHAVNTDEKLRVICLGNDRWGRKYWFWKDFGGVLVEDRGQVGPKVDKLEAKEESTQPTAPHTSEDQKEDATATEDHREEAMEVEEPITEEPSKEDDTMTDVTRRMETMASPELSGGLAKEEKVEARSTDNRMSISNLLSNEPSNNIPQEVKPVAPERDYLDYGAVQTWSLISTTKELASLTRALNGKGVRERVLKASLITMRKEIEESLSRIKKWAGNRYESKFEHLSELGAMGQLLTLTELQLLKKKRGRKSKQELADIAATEELVAANEAKAMDVDTTPQDGHDHDQDHDMDEPVSESKEPDHESDHEDRDQCDLETHEEAQAMEEARVEEEAAIVEEVYGEETGSTGAEYLEAIMEAAKTKLLDLSRTICGGDENVILNAVHTSSDRSTQDYLTAIVAVLEKCLDAMDMQQEDGIEVVEDVKDAKEEPKEDMAMNVEDAKPVEEVEIEVDVEAVVLEDEMPVSVSPRLLWWLQTCKIDEMLKRVQTFGALHAWLDECHLAITNFVDDGEGDDGEEQGSDVEGKHEEEDEESENSDHHEHEEDEDEDEDEDKDEHDDEEREQAGDEKAQDEGHSEGQQSEDDDLGRDRHRKLRKQPKLAYNVGGRSLRSRGAIPVSYKDVAMDEEEEEVVATPTRATRASRARKVVHQEEEEDDGDEEEVAPRRSKRSPHDVASSFLGRRSVRDTWIVLWVLWLFWAGLFIAKQTFGATHMVEARRAQRTAAVGQDTGPYSTADVDTAAPVPGEVLVPENERGREFAEPPTHAEAEAAAGAGTSPIRARTKGFFGRAADNIRERIDRTYTLVRDLTLMLLLVVTVNTFGLGSGTAVLVLSWIYLAIALMWALLMMLVESRILDMVLGSMEMLILLAMLIAAYSMGWEVFRD
ncbi:hypothetical protein BG005_007033 [Podila minutissima]|nr:hypothetical protein BG005_007033 [Podila minutissima]